MKCSDASRIKGTLLAVVVGILFGGRNANAKFIFATPTNLGSLVSSVADPSSLPEAYDLRTDGYVTSVKYQQGGTCWCHGTMAAIESNLLITGVWQVSAEIDPPNLAEYHLDWWNGFNQHNNDDLDPSSGKGLIVHQGGDYLAAAAYIARGEGVISSVMANGSNEYDDAWYYEAPARRDPSYQIYYTRNIEWYTANTDLSNIGTIKRAIMSHGAVATCVCFHEDFWIPDNGGTVYQPPTDARLPDHSVVIIGWDDYKLTRAPQKGAWLAKNSWGSDWNYGGYCWISFYDKHCGQDPEMGAVSFQNVEPLAYDHVYYHDYHGWRDTKTDCNAVLNAFVAEGTERIEAISFYTAADSVTYTVKVYDRFEDGEPRGELAVKSGTIAHRGFHTVDLDTPITVAKGDNFNVYLQLSAGGYAYDRTSEMKVLLSERTKAVGFQEPSTGEVGPQSTKNVSISDYYTTAKMNIEDGSGIVVESVSHPNESYYLDATTWLDLYDSDTTANFCIKALTVDVNPDFNRDKIINLADLAIFALAWQAEFGEEKWNLYCDLNLDSVIDTQDLAVLAERWLEDLLLFAYPIAHWALDEIEGGTAYDSVDKNHAELFGDPIWQPTGGVIDGALLLDGIDDFAGTEYVRDPSEGPLSVFAWVKGGAAGQVVISQTEGGVNWLYADPLEGNLMTELKGLGRGSSVLMSQTVITDGEWHRVGLTWDGSNRMLYVDDVEVAKDIQVQLGGSVGGLHIGAGKNLEPGSFFSGLIDDVRIYNRALTP